MERFDILALVGEGSFGRVYKAQEIRSNTIIALKIILKVCIFFLNLIKFINFVFI